MGLPQYGRQLYMRPSYLQLRDILRSISSMQIRMWTKLFWSVVHLVLANHFVPCT